jgi:hypothetical protein
MHSLAAMQMFTPILHRGREPCGNTGARQNAEREHSRRDHQLCHSQRRHRVTLAAAPVAVSAVWIRDAELFNGSFDCP